MQYHQENPGDDYAILAFHDPSAKTLTELDEQIEKGKLKEKHWGGKDLPFAVLMDESGKTLEQWSIRAFPTMVLIDPEGRLYGTVNGTRELDLARKGQLELPWKKVQR